MKYLSFILILFIQTVLAQVPQIPEKTNNYINDYANILTPQNEASLREISKAIELESSAQVVVVTTNDVPNDYPIEQYSIDLAQSWGIGQKSNDNGVLILICPDNRKSRIEVGYGLEGLLTDSYTKEIQVNYFRPYFKAGDYYTGIFQGLANIRNQISPEAREQKRKHEEQEKKDAEEAMKNFGHGVLNFFLWGGLLTLITILIVKYIKKKKAEEEAKRKEAEHKAYLETLKKREEERILNEANDAKKRLDKIFSKTYDELKWYGNFMNAGVLLNEIIDYYKNVEAELKDLDKKSHPTFCKKASNVIEGKVAPIKEKHDIKEYIQNLSNNIKLESITQPYEISLKNLKFISSYKENEQHNLIESPEQFYKKLTSKISKALNYIEHEDFISAKKEGDEVEKMLSNFSDICSSIKNTRENIERSIGYLKNAESIFYDKIKNIDNEYNHSYVSHDSKNKWEIQKAYYINMFRVDLKTKQPIQEEKRLLNIISKLNDYLSIASNEIEIKKREKRRKEEEEERKRKKREEEEEDDRRRRNSSSSSYWSSNDSSWSSSSSSSSSDTSFGGGSFGGGGSSDSW